MRIPSFSKVQLTLDNEADKKTQTELYREISESELPLHCPTKEMSIWNTHPRVYLPIEKEGEALCPYCGTTYKLREFNA